MYIDNKKIGKQIALLRASKGITQNELGERIGVTFQSVSKWERGETLPDVSALPGLANVLETTIDNILFAGEQHAVFKGKIKAENVIEGIKCLKRMGELLGNQNIIYRYAIQGIDSGMNTEIEAAFSDDYLFEAFVAEVIIQGLKAGFYVDITDINRNFKHDHFRSLVCDYAKKYNVT
ncbi:MAG: helix-turn-helix transcriptional regulator [Acutalibacteraceae bacterium]|nr:helix-turn-helix transcriptional regulator [Acutalibacteraceae bacterium]